MINLEPIKQRLSVIKNTPNEFYAEDFYLKGALIEADLEALIIEVESLRTAIVKHRDLCFCQQFVSGHTCPSCTEMYEKVKNIQPMPRPRNLGFE